MDKEIFVNICGESAGADLALYKSITDITIQLESLVNILIAKGFITAEEFLTDVEHRRNSAPYKDRLKGINDALERIDNNMIKDTNNNE